MQKTGLIVAIMILAVLATGLVGCGGGGGNGGGDTNPAALVGTWQLFAAAQDGTTIAPADAMGWAQGTVRESIRFNADGTCVNNTYDNAKAVVRASNGTWAVQGGVLTITFDAQATQLTYAIAGNIVATTETEGGVQTVLRWAKVMTLAGNDAAMVGTWRVASVEVDGVAGAVADFFEFAAGSDTAFLQLRADGTMMYFEASPDGIEDGDEGTWATGGGEIIITFGPDTMRGAYVANNTSVTFLDSDGSGVVFELVALAPAGQRDAAVVGEWQGTSVTVNGTAVAVADFFDWADGADNNSVEFFADGSVLSLDRAGTDILWAGLGTWSTNGAAMTVTFDEVMAFSNHIVAGDTLTVSGTMGGDAVVIVFTRVS